MSNYNTRYWWSVNVTDPQGSGNWTNKTFRLRTILPPPLTIEYMPPTPDDSSTIYMQTATINVSSNRELSNCTLVLLNTSYSSQNSFIIAINETMWTKWGFRYPVTYIFNLSSVPSNAEVVYRDNVSNPWKPLEKKTSSDFFNHIECVRFNNTENKAYISVGFNTSNLIYLKFLNVSIATFDSVARNYDNRTVAYTFSNDNWGNQASSNPGAPWQGMTHDDSDKYQAMVHACRMYNIPVSVAINSRMSGGSAVWNNMQDELNYSDFSWEPAVHTRTHPCSSGAYSNNGYNWEILGCRDDILENLTGIPFGQYVFEFILPCGFEDNNLKSTSAGEFLILRDWDSIDHLLNTDYEPWNTLYNYYGIGALQTKSYDLIFQSRTPYGRYYASDVATLNSAFDTVYSDGGIFYAMSHADRYENSVIYDTRSGIDGIQGSSFMQHLSYVGNRTDVWYVTNGWLYSYYYVFENVAVSFGGDLDHDYLPMTIVNDGEDTYAYYQLSNLEHNTAYYYRVIGNDTLGNSSEVPVAPSYRSFIVHVASPWWNTNWSYRKSITIDSTKVFGESPLLNFPVLIDITDDNLSSKAQSGGDDIIFTDYYGLKLHHEIEYYNNDTGHLIAWVNVTSLSNIINTTLYLYYGNPVCGSQENPGGVWNSNYVMVQHLNETSGMHYDSTSYDNDG
ncbi:MAG: DUF2341 domain-containing protein, partial [Candidatus Thermoplasmatota archaeon]|nr:DUF2341 domain-containing protein [Candidatus Thermoplasmatota archaeon]